MENRNDNDWIEVIREKYLLDAGAPPAAGWDAINRRFIRITLGDAFAKTDHTVYGYNLADGEISAKKLTPEAINEIRNG